MGLETGTYVDDLVVTNPSGTDLKKQGDDHLRLLKSVLRNTLARAGKAFRFPRAITKSADYTVVSTDDNTLICVDTTAGIVTLSLPTLASSDDGWFIEVMKTNTGTNPVFLVPPSGTINGFTKVRRTLEFARTRIVWNGGAFFASRPNGGVVGESRTFYGATLPNDCVWADGSTFVAANYVELNNVLGGNIAPDCRGRLQPGRDNMGVGAANRITAAGGNFDATVLGGVGGSQNHTLTTPELPAHNHTATVDEHGGHQHNFPGSTINLSLAGSSAAASGTPALALLNNTSTALTGITVTTANTGSGTAHSILPPAIVANIGIVAE